MRKIASLLSLFLLCLTTTASASYCIYCGKGSNESANFCSNCGIKLYKQTSSTNVYVNGNTTTKSTTTYVYPGYCNSTITYTNTTPSYTYSTSSNGYTQVIYTNPPVLPPSVCVYRQQPTVVYKTEPTFVEILIGGILAHQIYKHNHHHRHHNPRPAPIRPRHRHKPPRR